MKLSAEEIRTMRIMLVEDNVGLAKGICYHLQDVGHAVDLLTDGTQAESHLRNDEAHLVILDINLPGTDGLTLLKQMRARGDMRPVILLTARAETEDRVFGLNAGADDYLIKPFEMAELEARVRALLRRRDIPQQQMRPIGRLTYDPTGRQLLNGDEVLPLTRREMSVFECLFAANGRLVPKDMVLDHTYGVGVDVGDSVVEVYISRLRRRLMPFGIQIKVQRGLGYQLLVEDKP